MSRWTEAYENFKNSGNWEKIRNHAYKTKFSGIEDANWKAEALRFKKIVTHIDSLIEAVDEEIVPSGVWGNISDLAANCASCLPHPDQINSQAGNYQSINNMLDAIFQAIRPFIVSDKKAAQAATKAFITYSESVNASLEKIEKKSEDALAQIEQHESASRDIYGHIQEYDDVIFGSEDEDDEESEDEKLSEGIKLRIENMVSELTKQKEEIENYHKTLLVGEKENPAINAKIEKAYEYIFKVANDFKKSKEELEKLDNFYDKIFGKIQMPPTEAGEGELEREGGLDAKVEELKQYDKTQKEIHGELKKEIEGLLPGATSAGLASAYGERKKEATTEAETYTKLFKGSIVGLMFFGLIPVTEYFLRGYLGVEISGLEPWLIRLVVMAPIIIPLAWWALFCSKRRSENNRLHEEYAHKEALAKSYNSYRQQIKDLQGQDEELLKKLLDVAIDAVAYNPSQTLDKKHGDKPPVHEAIEKLREELKDLIPKKKGDN